MDEGCEKSDRMDPDAASHATPLGSPSYSPPGLEAHIEGKEEGEHDHDEADEEDEEEDEEKRAARRKAKGKGKAKTSPTTLVPIADRDMTTNSSTRQPRSVLSSHRSSPDSNHEKHFADTDAAMNEALPSPISSSYLPTEYHNATEDAPPPPPNISTPPTFSAEVMTALQKSRQQYQPHRGGGGQGESWGRGKVPGWDLGWRETMTGEREGWGASDEVITASIEGGETGWEVYDEVLWERAGEGSGLDVPGPSGLDKGSRAGGELGSRELVDADTPDNVEGQPEQSRKRRRGDLVRAARDYRAILPGTFLSYAKDEVLEVVHRDSAGTVFTLLPLRDGASSGRAHTRDFVPCSHHGRERTQL